jgi:diguanylate cyclase (GGDEF)-like protein
MALMVGEKILLADDDPQLLSALCEFLEGQGYVVQAAADGYQALAALREDSFHLAILDLRLPGPSGLELLSQFKAHAPDTEVILFTGHADLESAIQAMRRGAYDYLVKANLSLADFQAVVTRALERRRLALDNRELLQHLQRAQEELAQRRAKELTQIRRIGEALAGPLSWEQVIQGLLNLIWEGFSLTVLGLGLEGEGEGWPRQSYRWKPSFPEEAFQAFQSCLLERLRILSCHQACPSPPCWTGSQETLTTLLWSGLRAPGVQGLVCAGRDHPFSPEEMELFRIFTLQGEAAIKNLVLFEQVKSLAIRDGLTDLYNYRYFWEALHREVELARRYCHPLSLLFLDIDDFKVINDTLGHPQGDVVLKTLATFLQATVRQADLVCRYGGEEFVVLLPETPLTQARMLAERLRVGVTRLRLPKTELRFTVSIGLAELAPGIDGDTMVKAADAAMYRAKQSGKNRVCALEAA